MLTLIITVYSIILLLTVLLRWASSYYRISKISINVCVLIIVIICLGCEIQYDRKYIAHCYKFEAQAQPTQVSSIPRLNGLLTRTYERLQGWGKC